MAYPTVAFSIFFVLVLLFMRATHKAIPKNHAFIMTGLVFYAYIQPWMAVFLLAYAFATAKTGLYLENNKNRAGVWAFCTTAIGFLALCKYFNWGLSWFQVDPMWPSWAVPAALSFMTFQSVWAVLQSYRDEVKDVPLDSRMAHICFFPSISSGPIVALSQWKEAPTVVNEHEALYRIIVGLFQKLVLASIANDLGQVGFSDATLASREALWQSVFAYSFEIYFDFAGYSNMAVGVALLLGMRLPENFNHPYHAHNIQEFWRRWHISLSTFFRDNVYIHLFGGNRNGLFKQARNAMAIMLICGLWHGANATFVVWGLLHGLAIAFVVLVARKKKTTPNALNIVLTWMFVTYAWIWFRASSVAEARLIQEGLFITQGDTEPLAWGWMFLIACGVWVAGERIIMASLSRWANSAYSSVAKTFSWALLFVLILALSPRGMPSFIYYQF